MTQLKPPGNSTQKPSASGAGGNNFAKALLEIGGHTVQSAVDTGVQMAADALGALVGAGSNATVQQQNPAENGADQFNTPNQPDQSTQFNRFSKDNDQGFTKESQEQEWKKREQRLLRHREIQQVEVFDKRRLQEEEQIKTLVEQLDALSKDLDEADRAAHAARVAVIQGVTKGEANYLGNVLSRLINIVMLLRKKVQESTSWLEMFNSRKSAQKGYWGAFYSQGMQWAMSNERGIATSVG